MVCFVVGVPLIRLVATVPCAQNPAESDLREVSLPTQSMSALMHGVRVARQLFRQFFLPLVLLVSALQFARALETLWTTVP